MSNDSDRPGSRNGYEGFFTGLSLDLWRQATTADQSEAEAAFLAEVTDRYSFNGLVNNVGTVRPIPLDEITDQDYADFVQINMTAPFQCAQAVLPAMKAHGMPWLAAFIRGEIDANTAAENAKRDTRRYAKRQFTWIGRQFPFWPRIPSAELSVRMRVVSALYKEVDR